MESNPTTPTEKPIFYKESEMQKPISVLIQGLRSDISMIRGKLSDIRRANGYDDYIEHLEGGLTCMLSAMYHAVEVFEKIEKQQNA